jgi:NAD(P)-dependent dehydrogenase (short-subunit alcohol dehydrogenase family)
MYLKKVEVEDPIFLNRTFDGVAAYAETKRAQVVLTELWAEQLAGTGITVNAMHPGWADTPGVRNSLPAFTKVMGGRLRDSRQGADTIVWLAACERIADRTGEFFFDRRAVSPHAFPWTKESEEERAMLRQLCDEMAGLHPEEVSEKPGEEADEKPGA